MIGSATPCMAELGSRPLRAPLAHSHAQASQAKGEAHRRAYPQIEMQPHLRRPTLPRSLRARLRALAPDDKELGLFLEDLALAVRAESGKGYDLSDADRFEAGLGYCPRGDAIVGARGDQHAIIAQKSTKLGSRVHEASSKRHFVDRHDRGNGRRLAKTNARPFLC